MRRVIQFHTWQADVWLARAEAASTVGAKAYAWRQRATRQTLISQCRLAWRGTDQLMATGEGAVSLGDSLVESHKRR